MENFLCINTVMNRKYTKWEVDKASDWDQVKGLIWEKGRGRHE